MFTHLNHKCIMSVRHVSTLLARMASLGIRPVPPDAMVSGPAHRVTVTAASSALVLHRNDEAVTDPQHAPRLSLQNPLSVHSLLGKNPE